MGSKNLEEREANKCDVVSGCVGPPRSAAAVEAPVFDWRKTRWPQADGGLMSKQRADRQLAGVTGRERGVEV